MSNSDPTTTAGGVETEVAAKYEASLHLRLTLMISLLLALTTLVAAVYLVDKARADVRDEVGSTLNLARHFLQTRIDDLTDLWRVTGYSAPHFDLQALRNVRHLSIQQFDGDGRRVDSNGPAIGEALAGC